VTTAENTCFNRPCKPFLKWAGGKTQLLGELLTRIPYNIKNGRDADATYFEPFLGGGSLFFALSPRRATLSDTNARLVKTYAAVKQNVEDVIRRLSTMENTQEFFNDVRSKPVDYYVYNAVAAWFIYLNKTCFNGLYRVNREGKFNVPFGKYENPAICDADGLHACARALQAAELFSQDFEVTISEARAGDFVYFDPPYDELQGKASFKSYGEKIFSWDDQVRLRDAALKLKRTGVRVLLSNSWTDRIVTLYSGAFRVECIQASRSINSDGRGRGKIKEMLAQ
jgi:DNA adenine methylase